MVWDPAPPDKLLSDRPLPVRAARLVAVAAAARKPLLCQSELALLEGEQWAAALPRLLSAPQEKAGAEPELFATDPV